MYTRLTEQQIDELRTKYNALEYGEQNEEAKVKLAEEYKITLPTLKKHLKGGTVQDPRTMPAEKKSDKKKTRKNTAAKKRATAPKEETIADAINRFMDSRLEEQRKEFEAAWDAGIAKLAKELPAILKDFLVKSKKA